MDVGTITSEGDQVDHLTAPFGRAQPERTIYAQISGVWREPRTIYHFRAAHPAAGLEQRPPLVYNKRCIHT